MKTESKTFDAHHPKRVSFIIITKNRARFLEKALEQCREFVTPKDELIIADGASSDNTPAVVERFGGLVDVFVSEPDTHGPHAQNKGILLARGKFIKPLMDDDIYHPEAMERAVAVMEAHPEIDLLLCGGTKERNGVITDYCVPPGVNYGRSTEDVFRYKGAAEVGYFIRRSALARTCTLFPDTPNADSAFVLEFIRKGAHVRFCRINSFHHTIYDHSMTVVNKKAHFDDTKQLVKEYCSPWFYTKYRLRNLDHEYPILAGLWRFLKGLWDGLRVQEDKLLKSQKVIWDGGFS